MEQTRTDKGGPSTAALLAELLAAGEVEIGSSDNRADWPEEARAAIRLSVRINDCFVWGCADSETLTADGVGALHALWRRDAMWGGLAWAMIQRREMPQEPMERMMRDTGSIDLDELRRLHDIRDNQYDGVMGVIAARKYDLYAEWERSRGRQPVTFDDEWWKAWSSYETENPDWEDAAWKASEAAAIAAWYEAHGYEPEAPTATDALDASRRAHALLETAAGLRDRLDEGEDDRHGGLKGTALHSEKRARTLLAGIVDALERERRSDETRAP